MCPPLDVPESIRELALLPLIPKLLRLFPFSDFFVLISLFRCMTGVSAIGSEIFAVCGSGDTNPFLSSGFAFAGLPFFRFFSTGPGSG